MKNKGFTLIELLATIVVLTIVILIGIPVVDKVVVETKNKSNKLSLEGVVDSLKIEVINRKAHDGSESYIFVLNNGKVTIKGTNDVILDFKDNQFTGEIEINGGKYASCVKLDNMSYYKNFNDSEYVNYNYDCSRKLGLDLTLKDSCFYLTKVNNGQEGYRIDSYNYNCFKDITIPERIKGLPILEIGNNAFKNLKMKSIILPNTIKAIGDSAFELNDLATINIPSSVTKIGKYAFANNQLTEFKLNSTPTLGSGYINNNKITLNNGYVISGTKIISYAGVNKNINNIPSNITEISEGAFNMAGIENVTIPATVQTIGKDAFKNNKLTTISFPSGIRMISAFAFANNKITTINFTSNITSIDSYAFSSNELVNIEIPSTITSIGSFAFSDNKLKTYKVNNMNASLAEGIFNNNLVSDINLPFLIRGGIIYSYAGENKNVNITEKINGIDVTSINKMAFHKTQLNSINLRNALKLSNIGESAFSENSLTSIVIPRTVRTIQTNAFYYNPLVRIEIPNNITGCTIDNLCNNSVQASNIIYLY